MTGKKWHHRLKRSPQAGRTEPALPVRSDAPGEARKRFGASPATGIVNSAPLPMLSGQRCITLL